MKKINYLAAAFAISLSVAFTSCSKSEDEDASMLPPSSTVNTQPVASAPAPSGQSVNSGSNLQNSSACKCPGPQIVPVDTTGKD